MASEQNGVLDYWRKKCEEDRKKKVEVRKEFYRSNGFNMDTPMAKEVDVVNRVQCDPVPSRRSVREMVSETEVDVEEDRSVDHKKRCTVDRLDPQERISFNFEENKSADPETSIDPEENSTAGPEERMSVDLEESSSVDPKESTAVMTNWGSLIKEFWESSSIKKAFFDEIKSTIDPEENSTAEPEERMSVDSRESSAENPDESSSFDPKESTAVMTNWGSLIKEFWESSSIKQAFFDKIQSTFDPEEQRTVKPKESISVDSEESITVDPDERNTVHSEERRTAEPKVKQSGQLEYATMIDAVAADSMPFTLTFPVEYRFHGKVNGKHCSTIKDFRRKYNVTIEFDHKGNIVIVSTRGRCDDALQAMKRIKGLVAKWKLGDTVVPKVGAESSSVDANRIITEEDIPWTVKFPVENRFHSIINGRGYRRLRGLKKKYNVDIEHDYSGNIVITGTRGKCEDAMKRIKGVIARQVTATQENIAVDPGKRRSAGPLDSISVDLDESSEVDSGESRSVDPKERTAVMTNWGSLIKEFWGKSSIRKAFFVEIEEPSEADSWWAVMDD